MENKLTALVDFKNTLLAMMRIHTARIIRYALICILAVCLFKYGTDIFSLIAGVAFIFSACAMLLNACFWFFLKIQIKPIDRAIIIEYKKLLEEPENDNTSGR